MAANGSVTIIGISGGSGSGKTTFAKSLQRLLGDRLSVILAQDSYYIDQSALFKGDGENVNFDHPSALDFTLLAEHPRLGRLASSIRTGVRRHEHGSQVIVYGETLDGILILAVVHASSVKRLEL